MEKISPKVYVPLIVAIAASIELKLLTGDDTFLIGILVSLVSAGGGVIAPPAPGIRQRDVVVAARARRSHRARRGDKWQ